MNRVDLAGLIGVGIGFAVGTLLVATLTGFMC